MMNIVIFGAGKAGKFLYDEIAEKTNDIKVLAFIDNMVTGQYKGINIEIPAEFLESNKEIIDAVFVTAGAQKTLKLMINTVRSYGIDNIFMLHDIAGKCKISPFDSEGQILPRYLRKIRFSEEKPTLSYFEVPITDKCNLNCKGCLFACNAIAGSEHINYEQLEKDAKRMSELFYDIPWIRILGGEPLMHPKIIEILKVYRDIYPTSEIDLCTNGLLLPKMGEDFFECLQKNRISVHVSGYKPTYHLLEKIDGILNGHGLNYVVLKRESFSKYYTVDATNDMSKSHHDCIASGCHEVYNGRFLKCSAVIAFEKFNQQFKTEYRTVEGEDWFDIHKGNLDAWEMLQKIESPSQACRYCNVKDMAEFDWDYSGNKADIRDYVL